MPHLVLECTANIDQQVDLPALLARIQAFMSEETGAAIANFKSRAYLLDDYVAGDGDPRNAFVHLRVRLFAGRPPETKARLAEGIHAILQEAYALSIQTQAMEFVVEFSDIDKTSYFKVK